MLLRVCLVFFLRVVTVAPQITSWHTTNRLTSFTTVTTLNQTASPPENVQLVATPDYPVGAGQSVSMHCTAGNAPVVISWFWEKLENNGTWKPVGDSRDLTLTKPEESGQYRCRAGSQGGFRTSHKHTVYIVSIHATASDNLGIAGFVLSLLALIINSAVIFWLGRRRISDALTTSQKTTGKSKPVKQPKGDSPQVDADKDVYMNYTNTNQAYSDLDPTNMTGDNVYSSLS